MPLTTKYTHFNKLNKTIMTSKQRIRLIRKIKSNKALLGLKNKDIANMLGMHEYSVNRLLTENPKDVRNFTKETLEILRNNKLI